MEDRTVFQPSAGSVRPGAQLNGIYEIEKLIAQGGMGEVYRGFNIQTRHQVAIKMIRPEYSNHTEIFDLFRREALILANLTHEAIVRYFVFSVDPELGRAYLAMEFVDGPSLTKRLASGPLPLDDVKVLQRRLASALEAAHEHGVIHRDISPDNIILTDSDVRRAKIVDFGIARSAQPTEVSIIGGRFAGKYNFASPEQFGLAGGEVTFKSDIYSLGLVLAAALRGRPIDMSGTEVEAITKRSAVPSLSDIDPAIRPLIQAMLQPLPANRPASMAAVANWEGIRRPGLVRPRAGGKPTAVPEPAGGRTVALLGALIALASIGGASYAFREDLARWSQSVVGPTAPPGAAKLSPVGEPEARTQLPPLAPIAAKPGEQPPASAPLESTSTPSSRPAAEDAPSENAPSAQPRLETAKKPHVPSADELVAALPPRAPQDAMASPAPAASQAAGPLQPPVVSPELASRLDAEPHDASPAPPLASSPPPVESPRPAASPSPTGQKMALHPVAPALPPSEVSPPARLSPEEKGRAFVATFEGGDCFFVDSRPGETEAHAYQAFGSDMAPFERFDSLYKQEVGVEAKVTGAVITREECPALDLIRLGAGDRKARPSI
ncbi:MAG: protein kinase, partial [Hyphomicrobiales bacterium]|nr:protein kinase [Hyphomicrobiales bacterium]